MNSSRAMSNPQWGISQVPLDHISSWNARQDGRIHLFYQNREAGRKLPNCTQKKKPCCWKRRLVPDLNVNALHGLPEGPCSSQVVRTQRWPSGTNRSAAAVRSSDHGSKTQELAGFWQIGTIPSKYAYSHERGHSLHEQPSWDGYTHTRNGSARPSAGAVVDLGSPHSSATDFPNEPRGKPSPPGCPKHSCDNQLLQGMELKPTDHPFIISPHFGTPKRKDVTRKGAWRTLRLTYRPGYKCAFPRGQHGRLSVVSPHRSAKPVLPPAGILLPFSSCAGAQLSHAPGHTALEHAPAGKVARSPLLLPKAFLSPIPKQRPAAQPCWNHRQSWRCTSRPWPPQGLAGLSFSFLSQTPLGKRWDWICTECDGKKMQINDSSKHVPRELVF